MIANSSRPKFVRCRNCRSRNVKCALGISSSLSRSARLGGFALIELMAVVVLLVLMATVVTISLRGPIIQARLQQSINQIVRADNSERLLCSRSPQQGGMLIAAGGRSISWLLSAKEIRLPKSIFIEEIRTASQSFKDQLQINFGRDGSSQAYAIKLHSTTGKPVSRWLVVLGATGQVISRDGGQSAEVDQLLGRG